MLNRKLIEITAGAAIGKTRTLIAFAIDYLITEGGRVLYISDEESVKTISDKFSKRVAPYTLSNIDYWDTVSSIDVSVYDAKNYVICIDCVNNPKDFAGINKEDWDKLVKGAYRVVQTKQAPRDWFA